MAWIAAAGMVMTGLSCFLASPNVGLWLEGGAFLAAKLYRPSGDHLHFLLQTKRAPYLAVLMHLRARNFVPMD
jgi:hypothetical protein